MPTKSPTPAPSYDIAAAAAVTDPLSELPLLLFTKPSLQYSGMVIQPTGDNTITVDAPAVTAAASPTEGSQTENNSNDAVRTAIPPLVALPVPTPQPPSSVAAFLPPPRAVATTTFHASANVTTATTATDSRNSSQRAQLTFSVRSPDEDTVTAVPSSQDLCSQHNRRISSILASHNEKNDRPYAPLGSNPFGYQRFDLSPRVDSSLHSELGESQSEHLDEGGRVRHHLSAYYHYCADEPAPTDAIAERLLADRLSPLLCAHRGGVTDKIGDVVDTTMTLYVRDEQVAHPHSCTATSENGMDTVTLSATVCNAVKDTDASAPSFEAHESYEPLQKDVFESALRMAWEWRQASRAEASQTTEAGAASGNELFSAHPRRRLPSCFFPGFPSAILPELSQSASTVAKEGARASLTDVAAGVGAQRKRSGNSFSNSFLPPFTSQVKAGLQLEQSNDPYAPLTSLQLTACELCGAEMISRKTLWTSYLVERYELLATFIDVVDFSACGVDVTPSASSFSTMLTHNNATIQRFFDLALEEYLPWMADLYLAEYNPVMVANQKDAATASVTAAPSSPLGSRKFLSIMRKTASIDASWQDHCPLPLPFATRRAGARATSRIPTVASFLATNDAFKPTPRLSTVQPDIFTAAFLVEVSFVVLEELAIVARMHLPNAVANAMHLFVPGAASFTRDSLVTSLTHSVSSPVASESITSVRGRATVSTMRLSGESVDDASGADAPAEGTISRTDKELSDTSATAVPAIIAGKDPCPGTSRQSRLLRNWNLVRIVAEPQPMSAEGSQGASEAPAEAPSTTTTCVSRTVSYSLRRESSYENSRVWLKILFRFFRREEAYNFVNDSPIAMRNFLPLPFVSWGRMLMRSRSIMAWSEFHSSVAASTASLWGYLDKARPNRQNTNSQPRDRALRQCEQKALNMATAMHELWYLEREWWLQFVVNVFRATAPVASSSTLGGGGGCAGAKPHICVTGPSTSHTVRFAPHPSLRSTVSQLPAVQELRAVDPTVTRTAAPPSAPGGQHNLTPVSKDVSFVRKTLWQHCCRSPLENDILPDSRTSRCDSEVAWGSLKTNPARPANGDSVIQPSLMPFTPESPDLLPPPQQVGGKTTSHLLPGVSLASVDSSVFLWAPHSFLNGASQASSFCQGPRGPDAEPAHEESLTECASTTASTALPNPSSRPPTALPGARRPRSGLAYLSLQSGTYSDAATALAASHSRLMVPPMAAIVSCFYRGNASDWDTVLLVRCQSLQRAMEVEEESFERAFMNSMKRSGAAYISLCEDTAAYAKAEEDVALADRRSNATRLCDEVAMGTLQYLREWAQERVQLDYVMFAVLTLQSVAELQCEVVTRLYEDFQVFIREARSWVPPPPPAREQQQQQRKLITATMALGPVNSNSITDDASAAACTTFATVAQDVGVDTLAVKGKSRELEKRSFDFWGYGAFLPHADSPVGFNDGLVVMSRVCRDMHLRGRRLQTHWFANDDDDDDDRDGDNGDAGTTAAQNFHDIHYVNNDTYIGFTRRQVADTPGAAEQTEMKPEEACTPLEGIDNMTNIHHDSEDGAAQMLRHGLGNYTSKVWGYTYVGGWYRDRPHDEGGLLFNGILPWETGSAAPRKSLLLVFGRWEHGRLVHIEKMFSGVPLS
ncbi:hypothetical protein ABB37_01693 [Leptomonas pyrrhocoris]|uniref:Uncharacterized protein n=1 Tax=Leptomonas pyrrhocoris TaxID=157538 RepID=A0A0M9G9C3_LEPPY|nr:hypothetical protein ABB37_01693 [Leptomonas pyrrhocoris]KPA85377.1 hypothetical protein ABB37_01693 [Leptomonas pyrrhocoris]|eukprot:XP_015663816.1 hypothetical protein ABB37_01693 [Leptomonas pyrrhocoris]